MDRLAWCASYRTYGKRFRGVFGSAVVTRGSSFLDDLHLAVEARGTAFDQGHICGKTHLVDVTSRLEVVQGIEDDGEAAEPLDVELRILNVAMMCHDVDIGVEFLCRLFRDLYQI